MSNDLVLIGCCLLVASIPCAFLPKPSHLSKSFFLLGIIVLIFGTGSSLPSGTSQFDLLLSAGGEIQFRINPSAAWLMLFGLIPALLAGITVQNRQHDNQWFAAASITILGAIGVACLGDGISFLIAWEIMSLGGAYLLMSDNRTSRLEAGTSNLFMLSLLEVGSIALLLGILFLGATNPSFSSFASSWVSFSTPASVGIGVLFIIGFGAKLGILPFYEWYPAAYSSGRGASGAILSGIVLNVTWFALARSVLKWMPKSKAPIEFGILLVALGVISAILSILYGFQQSDWRKLLSFSTAENAGLAVAALGTSLIFRSAGLNELATMAFIVGLLHLGGHSLAKGSLMVTADHIHHNAGTYEITQHDALSQAPWSLGLGAILSGISLSALPPMAGFVTEWYIFQTVFHSFQITNNVGKVALALGGAGIALTAAVSLATMVKLIGVGLLGKPRANPKILPGQLQKVESIRPHVVLGLGMFALIYSLGMIWWIKLLKLSDWPPYPKAVQDMVNGVLLVPLSSSFAFISPLLLAVTGGLLALIPLGLIWLRKSGLNKYRKVPLWAHGLEKVPTRSNTTALVFSNALRQFYSFIYRPTTVAQSNGNSKGYFVKQINFEYSEAPIFGPLIFSPAVKIVKWLAKKASVIQMGSMNLYLLYIGLMLLVILVIAISV